MYTYQSVKLSFLFTLHDKSIRANMKLGTHIFVCILKKNGSPDNNFCD
jgi:hypothetical protein